MDHLPYCGDKAYDSFIAALRATRKGYEYVAGMLEAYDPSSAPAGDASADSGALVSVTSFGRGESGDNARIRHFVRYARLRSQIPIRP